MGDPEGGENGLLELLVSAGVAFDPALAPIHECLTEAGSGYSALVSEIERLRSATAGVLSPILTKEIADSAAEIGASAGGDLAALTRRLRDLSERADAELKDVVRARRAALVAELLAWSVHLPPERRSRSMEALWSADAVRSLEDRIALLVRWRACEEDLLSARTQLVESLRSLLVAAERTPGAVPEARRVRDRLKSGTIAELLADRSALQKTLLPDDSARRQRDREQLQGELTEACGLARGRPEVAPLVAHVEELLAETGGDSRKGSPVPLVVLETWNRTLRDLLRSPPATEAAATIAASARSAMLAELERRRHELPDRQIQALRARLESQAQGDRAPMEAILEAAAVLREERQRSVERAREAATSLREAVTRLETTLTRHAAVLPAERVVEARALCDRAGQAVLAGDEETVRSLSGPLLDAARETERLAQRAQRGAQDRSEADRSFLLEELRRLESVASGRVRTRLRAWSRQVEDSSESSRAALRRRMAAVEARLRRRIRLEAGRRRHAAQRLIRRRGASAAQGLEPLVVDLDSADDKDDLSQLQRSGRAIEVELRRLVPSRRPVVRYVAGAAILLALAGGGWAARRFTSAPSGTCTIRLDVPPDHPVRMALFRDGAKVDEKSYSLESKAGVSFAGLQPGRYEIFADGGYTGIAVQVRGSREEVTAVPLPRSPR